MHELLAGVAPGTYQPTPHPLITSTKTDAVAGKRCGFLRQAFLWHAVPIASLLIGGCAHVPVRQGPAASVECLRTTGDVKAMIDALAVPLIKHGLSVGMVVAVTSDDHDQVFSYGRRDSRSPTLVTADTIFAIGSLSKSFLCDLLALEVEEGRVSLDSPASGLFPAGCQAKSERIRHMTLCELASHCSGLPIEAPTLGVGGRWLRYLATGRSPYEGFTQEQLFSFLSEYRLKDTGKREFTYSNLGMGILSCCLGQLDSGGCEPLLVKKVIEPLGLTNTTFNLTDAEKQRLAMGHAGDLPLLVRRNQPVDEWLFDPRFAPAGGMYSTAGDLLTYLKANMGKIQTPLYQAMKMTHQWHAKAKIKGRNERVGLGWFTAELPLSQTDCVYGDGLIGGYVTFMGFDSQSRVGVVVLENCCNLDDHMGFTLLDRLTAYANSRGHSK